VAFLEIEAESGGPPAVHWPRPPDLAWGTCLGNLTGEADRGRTGRCVIWGTASETPFSLGSTPGDVASALFQDFQGSMARQSDARLPPTGRVSPGRTASPGAAAARRIVSVFPSREACPCAPTTRRWLLVGRRHAASCATGGPPVTRPSHAPGTTGQPRMSRDLPQRHDLEPSPDGGLGGLETQSAAHDLALAAERCVPLPVPRCPRAQWDGVTGRDARHRPRPP